LNVDITSPGQPFVCVACLDYLLSYVLNDVYLLLTVGFFLFVPMFVLILTAGDLYALVT